MCCSWDASLPWLLAVETKLCFQFLVGYRDFKHFLQSMHLENIRAEEVHLK